MKNKFVLDEIDLEAMRDGAATRRFHENYALDRPCTRVQAKRGIVRGGHGAKDRKGLKNVTRATVSSP